MPAGARGRLRREAASPGVLCCEDAGGRDDDMRGNEEAVDKILEDEGPMSSGVVRAARVIEERAGEILDDYARRLEQENNLLIIGEGNTRERIEGQARGVLERAASVLRGEERCLLAVEEEI